MKEGIKMAASVAYGETNSRKKPGIISRITKRIKSKAESIGVGEFGSEGKELKKQCNLERLRSQWDGKGTCIWDLDIVSKGDILDVYEGQRKKITEEYYKEYCFNIAHSALLKIENQRDQNLCYLEIRENEL